MPVPTSREKVYPFIGPILAAGALLLYSRTVAPSLGGTVDSAEFQQATYSLSIAHPTGYPLYLLIGRLWITIFPFGDPAYRVNLLSAIFGALSVWVLYETVRFITAHRWAAALACALFAVQAIPWALSDVAEINTMNVFLTALAFLTLVRWAYGEAPLALVGLTYGLDASHHRTALLYAPLLLVFGIVMLRRGKARPATWRGWLLAIGLFLTPFLAYLYLPLRATASPGYENTWQGFWNVVLGESALPVIEGSLQRPWLNRFTSLVSTDLFNGWAGRALALLGLIGLVAPLVLKFLRRRKAEEPEGEGLVGPQLKPAAIVLYVCAFIVGISFAGLYDIIDIGDYLGVPIFMWCVLAGTGIAVLFRSLEALARRTQEPTALSRVVSAALVLLLAGLVVFTANRSLTRSDIRVNYSTLDRTAFWNKVKAESGRIPQNAYLIGDWPEINEARYWRAVEGWRPDLNLLVLDYLRAAGLQKIDEWLSEKHAVFALGYYDPIVAAYTVKSEGVVLQIQGPRTEAPPPHMSHLLNRRFGDSIVLLGYSISPDPAVVAPGGVLEVTYFWKALKAMSERYVVFNHVIDASGGKIGQKDNEPGFGSNPTVFWHPGEVITDTQAIGISADASPGDYRLMSGLYSRIDGTRLQAYSASGEPLGDYPQLATVTVKP